VSIRAGRSLEVWLQPKGMQTAESSSAAADAAAADAEGEVDEYRAPEAKHISEILSKDSDDEALQKYKAQLLGAAAAGGGSAAAGDSRRVVIDELRIVVKDHDPLIFDLRDGHLLATGLHIVLQEGCEYKTQLTFHVQNEIVSGLKYKNAVYRGPLAVMKVDEMLGSYGPDPQKPVVVVFPRREWEEAPKGMMARSGTYSCKTTFVDDDGAVHLQFDYKLQLKKEWPVDLE
jgi:Rho GDP-dissociation inhibitor